VVLVKLNAAERKRIETAAGEMPLAAFCRRAAMNAASRRERSKLR
jgi:hypothetical protein